MHLLVHGVEDGIDNGQVVVGLLVLHPPHRSYFLVLLCIPGNLVSETHFFSDFSPRTFQVAQVLNEVHVGNLVIDLVPIVQPVGLQAESLLAQQLFREADPGQIDSIEMVDESLVGVGSQEGGNWVDSSVHHHQEGV